MSALRTVFARTLWAALLVLAVAGSQAQVRDPLSSLAGRPAILLFAKTRSDASMDRQLALLSEIRVELSQRKAVVIAVVLRRDAMTVMGYASFPAGSGNALFETFKPGGEGLTVVLLDGKQAELKRWEQTVTTDELLSLLPAAQ